MKRESQSGACEYSGWGIELPVDEVHVWLVDVPPTAKAFPDAFAVLSDEERIAASRFYASHDRVVHTLSRACLRQILSRYLGCTPQELTFATSECGKPFLVPEKNSNGLSFNVSHSGDLIAYAFTRGCEIGIDVEQVRALDDLQQIATRFFTRNEWQKIETLRGEERKAQFFRVWTRKEAFIKTNGKGLSIPLDSFEVSEDLATIHMKGREGGEYQVIDLQLPTGYAGAVATSSVQRKLVCRDWLITS